MRLPWVPCHVAIIADGNGRWAELQGMPRSEGHWVGARKVPEIVGAAVEAGVEAITVYGFSTENWRRPAGEVATLMEVFSESRGELVRMHRLGARVRVIGRIDGLPPDVREAAKEAEDLTAGNCGPHVYLAVNYGGRAEILDAARQLLRDGVRPEHVDEGIFSARLYAPEAPDVDLVIRTGGQRRVSNFVTWQAADARTYFSDALWPDFTREELLWAIGRYRGEETYEEAGESA